MLDELAATLGDIGVTVRELHIQISEAWDAFPIRLPHRINRFGYRMKGAGYEPEDWK